MLAGRGPRRGARARRAPVSQTGDWHASGRRRSPSSIVKPSQPSTARRSVSSSKPCPSAASIRIDQTQGGWIPPQEPSASWRSRTQRSASRERGRRRLDGPRRRLASSPGRAPISRRSIAGRPHRAQRLHGRERHDGLPRPAGEVVDRERRRRREQHASTGIGGIRCHGHCPSSARKHFVKTRLRGTPPRERMNSRAAGPGRRRRASAPRRPRSCVERSGGPSNQIDQVPSSRCRASSSFAILRSSSGVRRPRTWCQKRCWAIIVAFDSSSPTHQPPSCWSSSRRCVAASSAAIDAGLDPLRRDASRRHLLRAAGLRGGKTASHRALHRRGPAGRGPRARARDVRPRRPGPGPRARSLPGRDGERRLAARG